MSGNGTDHGVCPLDGRLIRLEQRTAEHGISIERNRDEMGKTEARNRDSIVGLHRRADGIEIKVDGVKGTVDELAKKIAYAAGASVVLQTLGMALLGWWLK